MAKRQPPQDAIPPELPTQQTADSERDGAILDHLASAAEVFDQLQNTLDSEIRRRLALAGVGLASLNRTVTTATEDHLAAAADTHLQFNQTLQQAIANQLQLSHEKMVSGGVQVYSATPVVSASPATASQPPPAPFNPTQPLPPLPSAANGSALQVAGAGMPLHYLCPGTTFHHAFILQNPQAKLFTTAIADGVIQPVPFPWVIAEWQVGAPQYTDTVLILQGKGWTHGVAQWADATQTAAACGIAAPPTTPPPPVPTPAPPPAAPGCPPLPCIPICAPTTPVVPTPPVGTKPPTNGQAPPPPTQTVPPYGTGPGLQISGLWPNWNSVEVCQWLTAMSQQFQSGSVDDRLVDFGLLNADGGDATPNWCFTAAHLLLRLNPIGLVAKWLSGIPLFVGAGDPEIVLVNGANDFAPVIAGMMRAVIRTAWGMFQAASQNTNCQIGPMLLPTMLRIVTHLIVHWLGVRLEDLETSLAYWSNYFCPTEIPSAAEADELYLRNIIDIDTWRCWVRANNVCDVPHALTMYAGRERPLLDQWLRLWNRKYINDGELDSTLRNAGVIDDVSKNAFKALAEEIPTISDVIHFMVRNTGDEDLVTRFGLDNEFTTKFTQQLADWAHGNGLSDTSLKHFWRAHWVVPSPGQLYQSFQRFRPEAVNSQLQFRLEDGNVNPAWLPGMITADMVTTPQDVDRALGENDVAPFWRNRLVALSFNPLTRRDAAMAYRNGVIKYADLPPVFKTVGYAEPEANRLAEMLHRQAILQLKAHPLVKQVEEGYLASDELARRWREQGFDDRLISDVLQQTIDTVRAGVTQRCVKSIEKRVLDYELRPDEGAALLGQRNIDPGLASLLAEGWQCELDARGKKLAVIEIKKLLQQGLITLADFVTRTKNLGYNDTDAQLLALSQEKIISETAIKALQRQQAAAEKAAKHAAMDQQKLQAQRARMEAARAARAAKAAAAEEKLTAAWMRLSGRIAKKLGMPQDEFSPLFTKAYFQMRNERKWSDAVINGVFSSIIQSIDKKAPDTWDNYLSQAIAAQTSQETI
jgi:hypothetical protein